MRWTIMRKKEGDKDFTTTSEIYDDEMGYPLNFNPEQKAYVDRLSMIRAQSYIKLYDEDDMALSGPDGLMMKPGDKKVTMDPKITKAMIGSEGDETEGPEKTRAKRQSGPKKDTKGGKERLKAAADHGSSNAARTAAKVPGAAQPAAEPSNPMGPNYNPSGAGPIKGRTAPAWTKE